MFEKIKNAFRKIGERFAFAKETAVAAVAPKFAEMPAGFIDSITDSVIELMLSIFIVSIFALVLVVNNTSPLAPIEQDFFGQLPTIYKLAVTAIIVSVVFFIVAIVKRARERE